MIHAQSMRCMKFMLIKFPHNALSSLGHQDSTDDISTIHVPFHLSLSSAALRESPNPIWALSWGNLLMLYATNKGADQSVHPHSLISTFVVHCLDTRSIKSSFYTCNFMTLASFCSWAGQFESYLVANPDDRFSRDEAHICPFFVVVFSFCPPSVPCRIATMVSL